jgi:hypothetical protein
MREVGRQKERVKISVRSLSVSLLEEGKIGKEKIALMHIRYLFYFIID